jgi:Flp pilus assembly CpaE family ATPase
MHLFLKAKVFAPAEDSTGKTATPLKMATDFEIPYLGSIPMDPNMLAACESGLSFLEAHPGSAAAGAFRSIVEKIVVATNGVVAAAPAEGVAK